MYWIEAVFPCCIDITWLGLMRRVPGEEVHQQFSLPIPGSVSPAPGDLSMLVFTPSDSFNPFGQSENCVN